MTRLSEILFIESLHCVDEQAPQLADLMRAYADPRLARALTAIHREPGKEWNVESLAREAGMSRTRFANHFQSSFGQGPIGYLTEWRLQRAASELRRGNRRIADIAFAYGYATPAGFSRAFKSRFGVTPRTMRDAEQDHGSTKRE